MAFQFPLYKWTMSDKGPFPHLLSILHRGDLTQGPLNDPDPKHTEDQFRAIEAIIESLGAFSTVLTEIAVIQDRTFFAERHLGTSPFFSSIVMTKQPGRVPNLLMCWHEAIKSLGNDTIVSHHDTYASAVLYCDFRHHIAPSCFSVDPSNMPDHEALRTNPAIVSYAHKYPFELSNSANRVEDRVQHLAAKFCEYLIQEASADSRSQLVSAIASWKVVVVPFFRPGKPKTADLTNSQTFESVDARPGGCVFLVLEPNDPNADKGVDPEHSHKLPTQIWKLAIRVSWLMQHATLVEAHDEIDMIRQEYHNSALVTHFFPTETRNLMYYLNRGLRTLVEKSDETAKEDLKRAHHYARRLASITQFSLHAYKVDGGAASTLRLDKRVDIPTYRREFKSLIDMIWNDVVNSFRDPDGKLSKNHSKAQSPKFDDTSLDKLTGAAFYHETGTVAILTECFRNVFKHSDWFSESAFRVSLICQPVRDVSPLKSEYHADYVLCLYVIAPPGSRSEATPASTSVGIGLTTQRRIAKSFGFPAPDFSKVNDNPSESTLSIAVIAASKEL